MTFRRPRFKKSQPLNKSDTNRQHIKVAVPSSKTEKNIGYGSNKSKRSSLPSSSPSQLATKSKKTKSRKIAKRKNASSTLGKKGKRLFFFSKKSKGRPLPNSPTTDSVIADGRDVDLFLRNEQTTDVYDINPQNINWRIESLHVGEIDSSRQGSEASGSTTTIRTLSPEPVAPTQSNPHDTLIHNNDGTFYLEHIDADLSLEDANSVSVLPTDLSMDLESLALEIKNDDDGPCRSIESAFRDIPIEVNTELYPIYTNSSKSTVTPADLSIDLDSLPQEISHEGDELHRSMEDVLYKLPHEVNDELYGVHMNSKLTTISSGWPIMSSGSFSEDEDYAIRSRIVDGRDFDSNNGSISEAHSLEKESATKPTIYVRLDDTLVEDRSDTSTDSNYHFVNLPPELQNDQNIMAVDADDESNSDSEVATASSDEDIIHLEKLLDNFGEEERLAMLHPTSSNEEELDPPGGTLSMHGLFKGDGSCNSSLVSFDSKEFLEDEELLEDEQFDDCKSIACCPISMHNITTILEENEDEIIEEAPTDHHRFHIPLNRERHLRGGTLSSVTDDSYMGALSFDSSSSISDIEMSPRGFYRKVVGWNDGTNIDMSEHEDFANGQTLNKPSYQKPFDDNSTQFTFESSLVSFANSSCSTSAFSYDSFSSKSVKDMVDTLKEETERRRSKGKKQILKIQESTDRASYISKYMPSRLVEREGIENSTKYMVDTLKEETERRRSKTKKQILKIRESTDRASYISEHALSCLMAREGGARIVR